jgi:hypothetical protein
METPEKITSFSRHSEPARRDTDRRKSGGKLADGQGLTTAMEPVSQM